MALIYKNQSRIEALSRKAGVSGRLSDLAGIVFSGNGRRSEELAYYQAKNNDAAGVNRHIADAGFKFWAANGGAATRADQSEHDFYKNGNFT